jgi:hypothetical protein
MASLSHHPARTPLGLPCLIPRDMYRYIDYVASISSTTLVPLLLEGDALKVYLAILVSHNLLIALTDYDQSKSSFVKRFTGLNLYADLKYMFYYDCFVTALSCYFPFQLRGFSVLGTKVIFWVFGIVPLPALAVIDYGDTESSSSTATVKKAE